MMPHRDKQMNRHKKLVVELGILSLSCERIKGLELKCKQSLAALSVVSTVFFAVYVRSIQLDDFL